MPRILFIGAHRFNRSPSQRYRFEQYFDFLEKNGFSCELSHIISENDDKWFYSEGNFLKKGLILLKSIGKRYRDRRNYNNYDIVFVQREAMMIGSTYFEKKIKKSKAKFVFDFDDSIWLMDTSEGNKKFEWLKNPEKTATNIRLADLVFAGNSYLANYARHYNTKTIVVPTTIDTDFHKPDLNKRNKDVITIGWSGSKTTIKHFEYALDFLKIIKQKYGNKVNFVVKGDPSYHNQELNIKGVKWTAETEVDVLNTFDIGIMPLPDDEWAKGKCGLKGLSYMACEIPTIMSPVGVNTEIIVHHENGFLANTTDEWVNCISELIENSELRKEIGKKARQTVIEKYSVEANKELYLQSFKSLISNNRA
ncbi:MAG: glycosyltransferase family 4 protein [Bacteroidota bacterium]|nr:glycosyltransferase family 4 protein [Bacteroidota bacterium]